MSRMMPGRLRQEGIELYDKGQLAVEKVEGRMLFLGLLVKNFATMWKGKIWAAVAPSLSRKATVSTWQQRSIF